MTYLLIIFSSYLLGSFPSAYILTKKYHKLDITKNGTGNVGTMNTYDVTKSKPVSIGVLVLDALKGTIAVLVASLLMPQNFIEYSIALIFAVLGHCFSIWIKFKGGRGLATALGGSLVFAFPVPILWGFVWLAAYVFRKNIHFANLAATILTTALSWSNAGTLNKFCFPTAEETFHFSVVTSIVMLIIFIKHLNPLKELINSRKKGIKK